MSKQNKKDGVPSALVMKGYEAVALRKHLQFERLDIERAQIRNKYINEVLMPIIRPLDKLVEQMRDAYALRKPDGSLKTTFEGKIDYGDKYEVVLKEYESILGQDVVLPIRDLSEFLTIRDIYLGTTQVFDEETTEMFLILKNTLSKVAVNSVAVN